MSKKTFNLKWKDTYPWLNSVPKDNLSAYCKLCKKIFPIGGKGISCVKEHAESEDHKKAERAHSIHRFFSRMF